MEGSRREEGFQLRRDANFLLDTDRCLTAVGAPVVLARNYAGYASLGRPRQGRWGVGDKEETPFKMASAFLKDRRDICVPVELLAGLIDEDSKLRNSARSWDMPDTVCPDLSWPGSCLENLTAGHLDAEGHHPPLLVHTSGPQNSHLALLRPRPPRRASTAAAPLAQSNGGAAGGTGAATAAVPCGLDPEAAAAAAANAAVTTNASAAIELEDRLALHAGPVRQISLVASRAGAAPRVFARCDYSATLVEACKVVDRLRHPGAAKSRAVYERRIRRAKVAAGVPIAVDDAAALAAAETAAANGGVSGELEGGEEEGEQEEDVGQSLDFDGFVEQEKLVFGKRLTCAACSPYTPKHAAFLDEEFRLFQWHADRGAATHGHGPLPIPAPAETAEHPRSQAEARRSRNADVAVDYGSHPRVLWIAGRHRACRIDLRENPSPAALKPALDPGVYYKAFGNKVGGRGEEPKIRSLAVGRRSAYDVFVAAGLHLAYMDVRFPGSVVARWDLPQEVDQLRWLPGVPGEGDRTEEIVMASGRRSPGYYVNTWAKESPGWRGCEARLGLDDTSPAASAARRPLTFSLPVTPLSEGETRSGGLLLALPSEPRRGGGGGGGDIWFVNATSAGDAYGQRLKTSQIGGGRRRRGGDGTTTAVQATPRSVLFSDRIQSMLPCGDVCLDPDGDAADFHTPAGPKTRGATAKTKKNSAAAATAAAAAATDGKGRPAAQDDPGVDANDRHRRRRRGSISEGDDDSAAGGSSSTSSSTSSGIDDDGGGARGSRNKGDRRRRAKGMRERRRRGGGGDSDTSGGEGADRNGGGGGGSDGSRGGSGRSSKRSTRSGVAGSVRSNKGDRSNTTNIDSNDANEGSSSGGRDSSDDGGGPAPPQLSQPSSKGKKRPRRDEARRKKATGTSNSNAPSGDARNNIGAGGGERRHDMKPVEYFPVNAGALRAAVEDVPENALCCHRHLAPLVDLVSAGKRKDGASGHKESAGTPIAPGTASAAAQQRERDFSDLRDRKDDVENFLLKPRTPEELLTFCRRTLGLEFPSDSPAAAAAPPVGNPPENTETDKEEEGGTERVTPPRTRGNLGGDSTSRGSTSSSAADNNKGKTSDSNSSRSGSRSSGSSSAARNTTRQRRIIDEAAVAVDVARAVLAWGKPFRNIETAWRAAAAGQSYSVAAAAAAAPSLLPPRSLPPRVSTLVLCSARKVLKGEPSPFLRPGTVGPPLAVDVTVEDVRWLKDEWDTSW